MPSDLQSDSFGHSDNLPSLQCSSQKGYLTPETASRGVLEAIVQQNVVQTIGRQSVMAHPTSWSKSNRIGLLLLAVYGAVNLIPTPPGGPGEPGPPQGVIIADIVLGLVMIAAVVVAWRNQSKPAATLACVAAILAALTALPAFVVAVPMFIKVMVGFFTVFAILAIALTLSPSKQA
jgi:hypothetical protein